jgi:hypothetical protein
MRSTSTRRSSPTCSRSSVLLLIPLLVLESAFACVLSAHVAVCSHSGRDDGEVAAYLRAVDAIHQVHRPYACPGPQVDVEAKRVVVKHHGFGTENGPRKYLMAGIHQSL